MANKLATDGTKLAAEAKKAGEEALKKASDASASDPRIAASASLSKDD
jgi:hypothetical protein